MQSSRQWPASPCSGPVFALPSSCLRSPRFVLVGCLIHVGSTLLRPSHRMYEFSGFFFCVHCGALATKFIVCFAQPSPVAVGVQAIAFQQNKMRIQLLFRIEHQYLTHDHFKGRPAVWLDVNFQCFATSFFMRHAMRPLERPARLSSHLV